MLTRRLFLSSSAALLAAPVLPGIAPGDWEPPALSSAITCGVKGSSDCLYIQWIRASLPDGSIYGPLCLAKLRMGSEPWHTAILPAKWIKPLKDDGSDGREQLHIDLDKYLPGFVLVM